MSAPVHPSNGKQLALISGLVLTYAVPIKAFGQTHSAWTLTKSIERALEISPELRAAKADVRMREAELVQAGYWPNPSLTVGANNKIGIDSGAGGSDLTQLMLSQPLPLARLARRRLRRLLGSIRR